MKKNLLGVFAYSFTLITALIIIPISAAMAEETDYFEQQKLTSHLLINLFLQKLDNERLLIFQHSVTRSDLIPHQVSYAHTIKDNSILARLHFKLKESRLIPGFDEYYVDGIIVEMDKDGHILEVSTQVYRKEKDAPDIQ